MKQQEAVEAVSGIAAGQWGLFTSAQAEQLGVGRMDLVRLRQRSLVRRVRQGVYAMPGVPSDAREEVRAQWLAIDAARTASQRREDDDPVVVCDESAAALHGMGDLPTSGVHLAVKQRLQTSQPWVTLHRRGITAKEYQWLDGLPVTTPRRTVEDIVTSGRWEHSQLRDLVADAINQGLIPRSDLQKSTVLTKAVPEICPPASHASVRQRLANDARQRGIDPQLAYNTFSACCSCQR